MKKLTKTTLSQMAALLPELDEEDQRSILGGTATTATLYDYTGSVPMVTSTVTGCYDVTGYYSSTTTAPTTTLSTSTGGYTFGEMNGMIGNGTWTGGYVDGMGYVGEVTTITGSYTGCATSGFVDSIKDFCSDAWSYTKETVESTIDKVTHVGSELGASLATGASYGYLDFKYNGADMGNGIGKIPAEEYLKGKDEYHAYHFSFEEGFWREGNKLPDNPSYGDCKEIIDVVTLPGFVRVQAGNKFLDIILSYGANKGIHYGIDQLLDSGEKNK